MIAYPLVKSVIIEPTVISSFNAVRINMSLSFNCIPFDAVMVGINVDKTGPGFIEFDDLAIDTDMFISDNDVANIFKLLRSEIMNYFSI